MSVRFVSKVSSLVKNSKTKAASNSNRWKSATTTTAPKGTNVSSSGTSSAKSTVGSNAGSATSTSTSTASVSAESSVPLGQTAFAATAGIATVSLAAMAVESGTASNVPPFDPNGQAQRFDQSTFVGRFSKMILACDPRLLLYSKDETRSAKEMVLNSQQILENIPQGTTLQEMHHALWEADRISSASIHPDTGDIIPAPFRMSGYVPFNGPICVAMVASTSTPALLFWSWANQSQNALVNYYNRNASSEMTNETLIKSYATAVTSALTVAFGLATIVQKKFSPAKAKQLMRFIAFPSAVVASSLNCYIVRSPEIDSGVPLLNNHGEDVLPDTTSKIAAKNGVYSTTASRAILQAPVYFLPPLLVGSLPAFKRLLAKHPAASVPLTTYLVLVAFGLGLPSTVAIFPQIAEIDVQDCEEEFQALAGKDGLPYQKLYYNKGL